MGRHKLYYFDAKSVRDRLRAARAKANEIHLLEKQLIEMLKLIDEDRYFVRFGYKSLRGFCRFDLQFTKTQAQRIVTQVRRLLPKTPAENEFRVEHIESKK